MELLMPLLFGYVLSLMQGNKDTAMAFTIILLICATSNQSQSINMMVDMVTDKENKMKETLKIMGLDKNIYSISHFVFRLITSTVAGVLCISMFAFLANKKFDPEVHEKVIFDRGQFIQLGFAQVLVNLNMIAGCLIMQDFFSDPKMVQIVGSLIFFIPTAIIILATNLALTTATVQMWPLFFYWFPTIPFYGVAMSIFIPDGDFNMIPSYLNWACLIIFPLLFLLFHLYLEQVLPNNFG